MFFVRRLVLISLLIQFQQLTMSIFLFRQFHKINCLSTSQLFLTTTTKTSTMTPIKKKLIKTKFSSKSKSCFKRDFNKQQQQTNTVIPNLLPNKPFLKVYFGSNDEDISLWVKNENLCDMTPKPQKQAGQNDYFHVLNVCVCVCVCVCV